MERAKSVALRMSMARFAADGGGAHRKPMSWCVPSGAGEPTPDRVGEDATGLGGFGEGTGKDGPVIAHAH